MQLSSRAEMVLAILWEFLGDDVFVDVMKRRNQFAEINGQQVFHVKNYEHSKA